MDFKYRKLRGRIIEKYGTIGAYAKVVGISINSMSKKLTGKTQISQTDIVYWCKLLDISLSEVPEYFFA